MRPIILHNLVRFKDALLVRERSARGAKRSYKALLNRHTGDLCFEGMNVDPKEWKEVRVIIREEPNRITFDLRDPDGNHLRHQKLAAVAWKVACELLSILNCKAEHLTRALVGDLPEIQVVQELAEEEESTFSHPIEQHPAWAGEIDRLEAEKQLAKKPRGAYLLRREHGMSDDIGEKLSAENDLFAEVYFLTSVAERGKIVDACILHTQRGWTLYRDNPDLTDSEYTFYPNIKILLANCLAK